MIILRVQLDCELCKSWYYVLFIFVSPQPGRIHRKKIINNYYLSGLSNEQKYNLKPVL